MDVSGRRKGGGCEVVTADGRGVYIKIGFVRLTEGDSRLGGSLSEAGETRRE
jgi:hypothetical protein